MNSDDRVGVPSLEQFLDDPTTRRSLEVVSARAGREVVLALDDEPVPDVMARLGDRADEPVLIAIPRLRWGFALLALERLTESDPTSDKQVPYAHTTSVGMLYDAVRVASRDGGEPG